MSPDGLFAQLVPLIAPVALLSAVALGISAIPRDEERSKRRKEHLNAFFGRAVEETPAAADTGTDKADEAPRWRGIDLTIFED